MSAPLIRRDQLEFVLDRRFQFSGAKTPGARPALPGDVAVFADQIKAVGKTRVGFVGGVVHVIDQTRDRKVQIVDAGVSHLKALEEVRRIFDVTNARVNRHRPTVRGVGFLQVDDEELNFILVLSIQLFEGTSLGPERRSGVAAEDESDRPLALERAEPHRVVKHLGVLL